MDAAQIIACQFGCWYPNYGKLTFRSHLIDLPEGFVDYLVQDGIYLPATSQALPKRTVREQYSDAEDYDDWSSDGDQQDEQPPQLQSFPELTAKLEQAIKVLGGKVIPKLNWSCPTDATWMSSNGSMLCTTADEVVKSHQPLFCDQAMAQQFSNTGSDVGSVAMKVILLLKSSDRVLHDISEAFDGCLCPPLRPPRPQLALRRYVEMAPEREFRCFVFNHALIAVSQRQISEFFPSLVDQRLQFLESIRDFHSAHLRGSFSLQDYTCDVYINRKGQVRLVDFNPVGGTTSPLLFTWEELPYSRSRATATMTQYFQPDSPPSRSSPMSTTMAHDPFAALAQCPLDASGAGHGTSMGSRTPAGRDLNAPAARRKGSLQTTGEEQMAEARSGNNWSGVLQDSVDHSLQLDARAVSRRVCFSSEGGPISPAPSSQLTTSQQLSRGPSQSLSLPAEVDHVTASRTASGASNLCGTPLLMLPDALQSAAGPGSAREAPGSRRVASGGFSSGSDVDISDSFCPDPTADNFGCPSESIEPEAEPELSTFSFHNGDDTCSSFLNTNDSSTEQQQRQEAAIKTMSCRSGPVEMRIVMKPNQLHQNPPRGGVPFDMVDKGEGGAVEALLSRLQAATFAVDD